MTSQFERPKATHETAQNVHTIVHSAPQHAVLLGIVKSVECELKKRGMLGSASPAFTPLWFLAETERNIFLWRQGKSLDDRCDYEFWVDVPALLRKRREQLAKPQGLNPFINPLWATAPLDRSLIEGETRYLDEVEDLLEVILPHAEALSHASCAVSAELSPRNDKKEKVLLPAPPPQEIRHQERKLSQ